MQIKTTMKCCLIPIRMATIKEEEKKGKEEGKKGKKEGERKEGERK